MEKGHIKWMGNSHDFPINSFTEFSPLNEIDSLYRIIDNLAAQIFLPNPRSSLFLIQVLCMIWREHRR